MESDPMLTPRKNLLYRRLKGGSNPRRCIMQDSGPNALPIELFRPQETNERREKERGVGGGGERVGRTWPE